MVRSINRYGIQRGLFDDTLYYMVVREDDHGLFRVFVTGRIACKQMVPKDERTID